jgi:hypothetical protein
MFLKRLWKNSRGYPLSGPEEGAEWIRGTILHEIPSQDDIVNQTHGLNGEDFILHGHYGDNFYQFCICGECGAVGFEFNGRSERIRCGCKHGDAKLYSARDRRILSAFAAARGARFEHGEQS